MKPGPHLLRRGVRSQARRQVENWRRLLAACRRKPSRRRIHALRVATLRLQARMEHGLGQLSTRDPALRVVRRWSKQAEKLRRALSMVRETDVHLGSLSRLRRSAGDGAASRSRLHRVMLKQIAGVQRRLQRTRKSGAKKLAVEIDKRRERLERLSKELAASPALGELLGVHSEPGELRALIAELAAAVPELNEKSLHEFRKKVKSVRYVAEMSAGDDALAAQQVKALRTMQSALGEWHDRLSLTKEARRVMRGSDLQGGLVELLETLAAESLEAALEVCRRTMMRLMGQPAEKPALLGGLPPRRPVQKAEPEPRPSRLRLA